MAIGPFQTYVIPGGDRWEAIYRVHHPLQIDKDGVWVCLETGTTLHTKTGNSFNVLDYNGKLHSLSLETVQELIRRGVIEPVPAVPYEKPLPRTRFERILDDSDGLPQ